MMRWNDDMLKWNPSGEFGNISFINLPHQEVWKPDLAVYSATPDKALFPTANNRVLLYHNGSVLWVPFFTIKADAQC
ncbi:neuronal acetylcholine receptor subunit alpha-7 [Caerostris extrusa]|uniref:Neuronal acetylcholine receptor subunit alpha-7 n=1 Tax=Caerostris extrusa TaxID=172846 RepID=A0AAV4S8R4_CAEEX|nr:neuronal acetylcholine receptor subunit alpha-7 [Caerostris extrusa]